MDRATAKIPIVVCAAATRQVEGLGDHPVSMSVTLVPKPFDIDHLLGVPSDSIGRSADA